LSGLRLALTGLALGALSRLAAAPPPDGNFAIPAGDAAVELKEFARQANVDVIFPTAQLQGVTTRPVQGPLAAADALAKMLAGTGFLVIEDPASGGFAIKRIAAVPAPVPASLGHSRAAPVLAATRDEPVRMVPYEVTGSHIQRLDGGGPQPVVNYSSDQIEDSGALTLGDFLTTLPFNTGSQGTLYNPSGFNTAYARGAVTLNPRGLGAQRFLVLINGRRAVTYGAPDSTGASVFDLNSIPIEAVSSVAYLKDGASAIYGSDAITGVLDIKLKQTYSGLSVGLMVGDVLQSGGQGGDPLARGANVLAGSSADGTSVMVNVNWYRQNGNLIQDYSRSRTTDFSSLGAKGEDDSSQSNWPFNVSFTATQAAAAGLSTGAGYYVVAGGAPTANPTLSQFTDVGTNKTAITDANRYNYAPTSQIVPEQDNWNVLVNAHRDVTPALSVSVQLLWSDDITDYLYTPNTINSSSVTVGNATTQSVPANPTYLSIPANNPYNPFGVVLGGSSNGANSFLGRALFGPTRTYRVDSTAGSGVVSLNGSTGPDWNWTLGLSYGTDLVATQARNNIRANDLQSALNGTLPGYAGDFLNPFGPSGDAAMVNSLFVTSYSTAQDFAYDGDLSASGRLMTLPGGDVELATGAEWRREELENRPDTTNYVVNPTSGSTPFSGARTISSEFVELDVPLLGRYLELQAAGRHDQYNRFGGTTNPKLDAVTNPWPGVKLRGSYSQSFKVPDLGQLFLSPTTTYSATNTLDPLNPQVPGAVYPQLQGGNPKLQPETGKVWYWGGMFDLGVAVPGLSLTVDHLDFNLSNVITTFTNSTQLFTLFPSLVVRGAPTAQAPNGPIEYFDFIPINAAAYDWRGYDLGLHYALPPLPSGQWTLDGSATRITYFGYNAGTGAGFVNRAGQYNNPRWTGELLAGWKRGPVSAHLAVIYKGPYLDNANAAVWGENPLALFNATVAYEFRPWRTTVSLVCDNVFNTPPPPNGLANPSDGFDVTTYAPWAVGRFVTLKVKKEF
jgi:outer membrane receptor protein involved in Fe transport